MPSYQGSGLAKLLRDNQQAYFWNNEGVAIGELSVAFQLERINRTFYPWGASFEVVFSGNPGTFEIDIMGANNDVQANYIELGSITSAAGSTVAGQYVGRWDMASNMWPKFVAGYVKALGNVVNVALQVTR